MSTAVSPAAISVDEFQALEEKVLRAVEIVRREREGRYAAEAETARVREQLAEQTAFAEMAMVSLKTLEDERVEIRGRVEKMLTQMDELL